MVGKTDKNDAARHGLDMTFIPVSYRRFLRVPVRVNDPGVAVIGTAQQALLVEIAHHVATWRKGLFTRAADKPHHGHRRRFYGQPEGVLPFKGWVALFRDAYFIGIKIHLLAASHLQRLKLLANAIDCCGIVTVFLRRQTCQTGKQCKMFLLCLNRCLTLADHRPRPPAVGKPRLPDEIEQMFSVG